MTQTERMTYACIISVVIVALFTPMTLSLSKRFDPPVYGPPASVSIKSIDVDPVQGCSK